MLEKIVNTLMSDPDLVWLLFRLTPYLILAILFIMLAREFDKWNSH